MIIASQLLFFFCIAQKMELKDLTELLDVAPSKLSTHLQKKGFRKVAFLTANEDASLSFVRTNKEGALIQYYWLGADKKSVYETTSVEEFSALKTEIKNAGFMAPNVDSTNIQLLVYQKQVITIETSTRSIETTLYYVIRISKKDLPKKKDIVFAEDLLMLDSHEYLAEMFGKENVKADIFYYSEEDSNRCSVLFPKSNKEAIVLWKDEVNLRNISFIIIGGNLRSSDNSGATNSQSFNGWRSRQGPYCGMSLKDVETINKEPIKFFNWHTESAGYLAPKNKGEIDFETLGIAFSCMNCSFIKVSQTNIIDSATAMEELQKVFVTTLIILPEKKK
jgi:hypothetical protein